MNSTTTLNIITAISAAMLVDLPLASLNTYKPVKKKLKECLLFGNQHNHNNAFCNPKCCQTWTINQRKEPGTL